MGWCPIFVSLLSVPSASVLEGDAHLSRRAREHGEEEQSQEHEDGLVGGHEGENGQVQ